MPKPPERIVSKVPKAAAKSRKELAGEYGVSDQTFRKWLDEMGLRARLDGRRILKPSEVQEVYDHLGYP